LNEKEKCEDALLALALGDSVMLGYMLHTAEVETEYSAQIKTLSASTDKLQNHSCLKPHPQE
jgi:hypothetical protein